MHPFDFMYFHFNEDMCSHSLELIPSLNLLFGLVSFQSIQLFFILKRAFVAHLGS